MIEQVLISGQIGKAVYVEDGAIFVLSVEDPDQPKACRQGDVTLLLDCEAEFTQITDDNIGIEKIKELLEEDTDRQRALTFLISGFDADLSDETRRLSIEAAEELLQNVSVLAFAQARLLARPLPGAADTGGAISLTSNAGAVTVNALYKELVESQEAIQQVLDCWKQVPEEFFASYDDLVGSEATLIETGVIAGLVSAVASKNANELNNSVARYSRQLEKSIPQITHILDAIRTQVLDSPAFAYQDGTGQYIHVRFGEIVGLTTSAQVYMGDVELYEALSAREHVVMVRVNDESLKKIDAIIQSGIITSRSAAAAFLISEGIKAHGALFNRIKQRSAEIERLRSERESATQTRES